VRLLRTSKYRSRKNEFTFSCDYGLCCLAHERAEHTRTSPCGGASVIVGLPSTSQLTAARHGSVHTLAKVTLERAWNYTGSVCPGAGADCSSMGRGAVVWQPLSCFLVRLLGRFLHSPHCGQLFRMAGLVLKVRSVEEAGDTGCLTGSASFRCNPAWGRHCTMVDVYYMLTRRNRLQYMRCNGVGGSTCRSLVSIRRFPWPHVRRRQS
jgi:hypothetical protein